QPEAVKPRPSRPCTAYCGGAADRRRDPLLQPPLSRGPAAPGTKLRVGDVIHIRGHTTDFTQKVESLEVNHAPVAEVGSHDDFGLRGVEHAREHDIVYKV